MNAYLLRSWVEDGHIKTTLIGPFISEEAAHEYVSYLPPDQRVSVTYRIASPYNCDATPGEYMADLWENRR